MAEGQADMGKPEGIEGGKQVPKDSKGVLMRGADRAG